MTAPTDDVAVLRRDQDDGNTVDKLPSANTNQSSGTIDEEEKASLSKGSIGDGQDDSREKVQQDLTPDEGGAGIKGIVGNSHPPTQFAANGEPIINTGYDVSMYLVSLRDDGDQALTLRSWVLGILLSTLNNVTAALFTVKPTGAGFSDIFNMLLLLFAGNAWARLLPTPDDISPDRPRLQWLKPVLRVVNHNHHFGLKEHVVALLLTSIGYVGGWIIDPFVTAKLCFNASIGIGTIIIGVWSLCTFGVGLVGLLAPAIVYPSEMVYWGLLPLVTTFQALHYHEKDENKRRVRVFGWCLLGAFTWEIVPAWMMPWLNGISIPCLASMKAPQSIRKQLSRYFGGTYPNQGLGFFSISLDPQYVSFGSFAGYPLKWQIQYFGGALLGAVLLIGIYETNVWNAKSYPFMTPALYDVKGEVWDQGAVFDSDFRLNETALGEIGLPRVTAAEGLSIMANALGLGALIVHVFIFLSKEVLNDFKKVRMGDLDDPHWQAMQKYKNVSNRTYLALLIIATPLSFATIYLGHSTLPWWGLIIALVFGSIMTPISLSIYGRYGSAVPTTMASKILAGFVHPNRPVANLYFAIFSHQVVESSGTVAMYLKMGQYLKIPPRTCLAAQLFSMLYGAYVRFWVLSNIIDHKRDILLDPVGNNQFYGGYFLDINTNAVIWSFAGRIFSHGDYVWIPLGLLIGACVPVIHWICTKYIRVIREAGDLIATPIFLYDMNTLLGGINSPFTSSMALAIFSQVWLRTRKPKLFNELNYLVAAAVDGGVAILIFVLSFAVMGASGSEHPFPHWFGNPGKPDAPDHCLRPS